MKEKVTYNQEAFGKMKKTRNYDEFSVKLIDEVRNFVNSDNVCICIELETKYRAKSFGMKLAKMRKDGLKNGLKVNTKVQGTNVFIVKDESRGFYTGMDGKIHKRILSNSEIEKLLEESDNKTVKVD